MIFLVWIAAFVAENPADNPNGNKTLLAGGVSVLFINGKPAGINDRRKLTNSSSWLVIFAIVLFNKVPLFSNDLLTFIISFISLFYFWACYILFIKPIYLLI